MRKTRVCVLFGGKSEEYEVSLRSAYTVLRAIDIERFEIIKIGITRQGEWFLYEGENEQILSGEWVRNDKNTPTSVDFVEKCFTFGARRERPDVIFGVLHGAYGEDGRVQALCELLEIPHIGASCASSALCMDKLLCKTVAMRELVPIVPFVAITRKELIESGADYDFEGDVFVKPSTGGSSIGISHIRDKAHLPLAIDNAMRYSSTILIERAIKGSECEVAVFELDGKIMVSEVGQISYKTDFYDYDAKYHSNSIKYKIPAKISEECRILCQKYALKMFNALGVRGLCRVDFFVSDEGEVYFNEVNSIPGFTEGSMYPMLMARLGYDTTTLITTLIEQKTKNLVKD